MLGGGPAGAAAAITLARHGKRVILLTRPAPGPPLAESLTPSVERVLDHLGLLTAVNDPAFVRCTGHTVRWGREPERVELFAMGAKGWQVPRDAFDKLLLKRAASAGASVHRHASVRRVIRADGCFRVSYEERSARKEIVARFVIDATGRTGLTSRAPSSRDEHPRRTTALVGLWERRPAWALEHPTHTHVESYDGGWAWSVPISKTRRQVTVMLDPSRTEVAAGARIRSTYRDELARTEMIRTLTSGARFIGNPWARDATPYRRQAISSDGVIAVGDSAAFVDPLSSFGVKKALVSGWLAAVAVRTVLDDRISSAQAFAFLAERNDAMVGALERGLAELVGKAGAAHGTAAVGYWDGSGTNPDIGTAFAAPGEPDLDVIRADARVRTAFDAIRERRELRVRRRPDATGVMRATVEGDRIVLAEHFVGHIAPEGVRSLRNVDLGRLAAIAPGTDDIPALYASYVRQYGPAELTDMVGALAVLVALGVLEFLD